MKYDHTQKAPLFLILVATGLGMMAAAWLTSIQAIQITLVCAGAMTFLLSLTFRQLTIRGETDGLLISFGPVPLFRRFILYSNIESVEQSRSSVFDGWGIHLSPRGGWTWNLWGFDCVDLCFKNGGKVRIGTDDPEGLSLFLKTMK